MKFLLRTMGLAIAFLFVTQAVWAESHLVVKEAVIARNVVDRTPVDAGDTFPADVGKVFCFTKIAGGGRPGDYIKHVWYYKDKKMAEVELDIRSPYFRTYSSKNILPSWKGEWRVEVVAGDGTVLKELTFTIE